MDNSRLPQDLQYAIERRPGLRELLLENARLQHKKYRLSQSGLTVSQHSHLLAIEEELAKYAKH